MNVDLANLAGDVSRLRREVEFLNKRLDAAEADCFRRDMDLLKSQPVMTREEWDGFWHGEAAFVEPDAVVEG